MTRKEAAGVIKFEKACVLRQDTPQCHRDCKKCDLLLPTEDVLTAYDMAIKALEQQPCEDTISRADVEQTVEDNILCYTHSDRPIDQDPDTECDMAIRMALRMLRKDLRKLPSAQPERTCVNCGRTANNGGWYEDGRTRCPIEEHYALPKDGYCHLWERRNVTDDDYPERRTDEAD